MQGGWFACPRRCAGWWCTCESGNTRSGGRGRAHVTPTSCRPAVGYVPAAAGAAAAARAASAVPALVATAPDLNARTAASSSPSWPMRSRSSGKAAEASSSLPRVCPIAGGRPCVRARGRVSAASITGHERLHPSMAHARIAAPPARPPSHRLCTLARMHAPLQPRGWPSPPAAPSGACSRLAAGRASPAPRLRRVLQRAGSPVRRARRAPAASADRARLCAQRCARARVHTEGVSVPRNATGCAHREADTTTRACAHAWRGLGGTHGDAPARSQFGRPAARAHMRTAALGSVASGLMTRCSVAASRPRRVGSVRSSALVPLRMSTSFLSPPPSRAAARPAAASTV